MSSSSMSTLEIILLSLLARIENLDTVLQIVLTKGVWWLLVYDGYNCHTPQFADNAI